VAVLKEWKCPKHGVFESDYPICNGDGCNSAKVVQVFLTAPSFKSGRTKGIDRTLKETAAAYGLTDMSNAGGRPLKGNGNAIWGQPGDKNFGGGQVNLQGMLANTGGFQQSGMYQAHGALPKLVDGRPPTQVVAADRR